MRISTRLNIALALSACVAIGVMAGMARVSTLGERSLRAELAGQEVARDLASLLTLTQEYTLYLGERPATQWHARFASMQRGIAAAVAHTNPPHPALLALRDQASVLDELFRQLEQVALQADSPLNPRQRSLVVERLTSESQELVERRFEWAQAVGRDRARQQRELTLVALAGPGLLLVVCAGLAWTVSRRMLAPLARLRQVARDIQGGALSARVGLASDDELGDTAASVDAMADSLVMTNAALAGEVEQRRKSQDQLHLVIDNLPALIAHVDADRRYVVANRAYMARLGRGADELVGHRVEDVHDDADRERLMPQLDLAFKGQVARFETELEHDGDARILQVTFVPEIEHGRVAGVFVLKTNVTSLRQAEERLQRVMDASPLGMFTTDQEGRCLYANPAVQRIVGLSVDACLGSGLRLALDPMTAGHESPQPAGAWAWGGIRAHEHRITRTDGQVVWVRANLAPLPGAPQTTAFVGTLEDVTERRQLQEALEQRTVALTRSNEDLARFAYVASHDLQEPIRVVNSYAQLLKRRHEAALNQEAREFLGFMVEGGQRALTLIRDLLSLSRLDSQVRPFDPVPLAEVLHGVLQDLRMTIEASGATVTHDELPTVLGDRVQLGQLLANLLSNAIKFRGQSAPRVHLHANLDASRWRISVADNGIGIDAKYVDRIFLMFQRLHVRSVYAGNGIGLAVCKRVVERHGGRIEVESVPGQGSTFRFTLPGVAQNPAPRDGASAEQ